MLIGKIVGSVVSTRKNEKLIGSKFMIVESEMKKGEIKRIVAVHVIPRPHADVEKILPSLN